MWSKVTFLSWLTECFQLITLCPWKLSNETLVSRMKVRIWTDEGPIFYAPLWAKGVHFTTSLCMYITIHCISAVWQNSLILAKLRAPLLDATHFKSSVLSLVFCFVLMFFNTWTFTLVIYMFKYMLHEKYSLFSEKFLENLEEGFNLVKPHCIHLWNVLSSLNFPASRRGQRGGIYHYILYTIQPYNDIQP